MIAITNNGNAKELLREYILHTPNIAIRLNDHIANEYGILSDLDTFLSISVPCIVADVASQ